MSANVTAPTFKIGNSVGRKSKGAINDSHDVETIQDMLRLAAMIESDPRLDPGAIDGTIDANEALDDTIKAIESFQARFANHPDGLIEVGKRTWKELMTSLEGDEEESNVAAGDGPFFFPFKQVPEESWEEGMRRFGASRSNGKRAHAGCDLYAPIGTTIHAITTGTVTKGPYAFYQGTFALEIDHGTFLARYGEIQAHTMVKQGDQVTPGQPIAKVGDLTGMTLSMLHLELYDKSEHGDLTVKTSQTKRTASGVPFWRRKDLINPTSKLNQWKNNLP